MKSYNLLLPILIAASIPSYGALSKINPGKAWNDTSGKHINAHGGCVVHHDGEYYWFGEDRTGFTSNGVSCYKSSDLYNWQRVGLVFKTSVANDPTTGKCIFERPKVIYNDLTQKWVMYCHWENGDGYGEARVCVGVCDRIDGDYEFVDTFRPNGHDSRDQTIFKDSDGKAYHFGSTDMNTNMNVALLSDDYLSTETNPVTETKILNGLRYEAPAIIKAGDTYFGVFSGCTGWDPNPGHTATATDILGYWEPGLNFCTDDGAATSYQSQSTFILKVPGHDNSYIYMGDRWNQSDIGAKSEYVWLPLSLRSGAPTVQWYDSWDLTIFDHCDRFRRLANLNDGAVVRLLDKFSDRWVSTTGNGFFIDNDNDDTNLSLRLEATYHPYKWRLVDEESGNYLQSMFGALSFAPKADLPAQIWTLELQEDGTYRLLSGHDGKAMTVAGSSQRAGSQIFMTTPGATTSQSFGIYFDSETYDYEAADMFSAEYREKTLLDVQAQREFDESGVDIVSADTFSVVLSGRELFVESPCEAGAILHIIDATSGMEMQSVTLNLNPGHNATPLNENIGRGVYVVSVETKGFCSSYKIIVR